MGYLTATLGFVGVFGAVVFAHELGHYLVAKYNDVEVETFSFGLGPRLAGFQYGETEYRLSALPLGGYVKLLGENPHDPEEAGDDPRAFANKSIGARTAVLLAGAVFNLLLGYVLYVPHGMVQGEVILPARVGYVHPDKPAHGKLQVGDRIVALNGQEVESFEDITLRNELLGDVTRKFLVERDGERRVVRIDPVPITRENFNQTSYVVGIDPFVPPVVGSLSSDAGAREAGLRGGDRLTALNGDPVRSWNQFQERLRARRGSEVSLTLRRDGTERSVTLSPPGGDSEWRTWMRSMGLVPRVDRRYAGPLESLVYAAERTVRDVGLMYRALAAMVQQRLSPENLAGPLGIMALTGRMANTGFWPLVRFTAFFSINLGILNLLPIPVLDGGHIALSVPEMLTGTPLSQSIVERANRIGLALLLGLLVFVTYNDLLRLDLIQGIFKLFGT